MGQVLEGPHGSKQKAAGAAGLPDGRDVRSDYLKAVAIVGVVCIHAGIPYADVFRFCVPVFIAVWAYHYERGLARRAPEQMGPYAAGRFARLLPPYLAWTALYLVIIHAPSEWTTTPAQTIVGLWFGGYGWPGQYFFIILFQLVWLLPLVRKWVTPSTVWIALFAGAAFNAVAKYWLINHQIVPIIDDRLFLYWVPYVFLGIAFARGYPRRMPLLLPVAVLFLLAVPVELDYLASINVRGSAYLLPTVTLGTAALLLAVGPRPADPRPSAPAPAKPSSRSAGRMVRYLGQRSLDIYVGHVLVILAAGRLGFEFDNWFVLLLYKLVLVITAIGTSLALGWVLRRLRLGALVGG